MPEVLPGANGATAWYSDEGTESEQDGNVRAGRADWPPSLHETTLPASVRPYRVIVDAGVAALLGAGVTGVVAIAAQMLGGWLSARSLRSEARSARLANYLSASYGGVLAIGQVARAPMDQKLLLERELVWAYMDQSNNALTAIELHDAPELVVAAQAADRAVADLMSAARGQEFDRQTWRDQRHALLDDKLAQLKQVGRRHVRGSGAR